MLLIAFALLLVSACSKDPETEPPWKYPTSKLRGVAVQEDSLTRQKIFLLYSVDGVFQDTLWLKPHTKPHWDRLFQIHGSPNDGKIGKMTLSCPGKNGHVEIHSAKTLVGNKVRMQLADSLRQTDFFRLIDRRETADSLNGAAVYQGLDVELEVQGLMLYPYDSSKNIYSGHIALTFAGIFESRKTKERLSIEGYLGAW